MTAHEVINNWNKWRIARTDTLEVQIYITASCAATGDQNALGVLVEFAKAYLTGKRISGENLNTFLPLENEVPASTAANSRVEAGADNPCGAV